MICPTRKPISYQTGVNSALSCRVWLRRYPHTEAFENEVRGRLKPFAHASYNAALAPGERYFTSRAKPLSKISPPTSHANFFGSSLRITLSPSQEPRATSGKPMAISAMLALS